MGQFSWLDCCNQRPILGNTKKPVYVLVPEEFRDVNGTGIYGEKITEEYYDGYGHFCGYDAFDLLALWNRDHVGEKNIRVPKKEQFKRSEFDYELAMDRYEGYCERIRDFISGMSPEDMQKKWGKDYLREIGIDIGCYSEENANLKYPLKITYNPDAVYEACPPSLSDPEQGWSYFSDEVLKTVAGSRVEKMIDRIAEENDFDNYDVKDDFASVMQRMESGEVEKTTEAIVNALRDVYISTNMAENIIELYDEMNSYDEKYSGVAENSLDEREDL